MLQEEGGSNNYLRDRKKIREAKPCKLPKFTNFFIKNCERAKRKRLKVINKNLKQVDTTWMKINNNFFCIACFQAYENLKTPTKY